MQTEKRTKRINKSFFPYFALMKKAALILFIVLHATGLLAQKKIIQKLLSNEKDTSRKASFMPIPVLGYTQETGLEFGLGGLYAFYVDRKDSSNRSSNLSGNASYSTKKTYNISLKGDIWMPENRYHILSEIRFKRNLFNFYGIGNDTQLEDEEAVLQQYVKTKLEIEKQILPFLYTGLSFRFENYKFSSDTPGGIFKRTGNPGGSLIFLGLSQSYDTRNSNNYPTKGFFGRLTYQYAPDIFGNGHFSGGLFKADVRNFWKLSSTLVLGAQGLYQSVNGQQTPFYILPQLGNDEIMRGYYGGRFRDKNLLAMQAELRYRFMNRFGLVIFGGAGKVFQHDAFSLQDFKPSYGLGGRYFFDTAKGLSIRLDYGVGEKNATEKRQSGFYISLAEAF